MKPLFARGLVLAALFLAAACQTLPDSGGEETISLGELKARILSRQEGVRDLKSFVKTTVDGKRRVSFNQVLLVEGANSVRLDTLSMFGQTLGVFIHSPAKTLLYDPGRNRTLEGEAVWDAMERTVGTRIDIRQYAGVFLGRLPEDLRIDAARLSLDKTRYLIQATRPGTGEKLDIEVGAFTYLPERLSRKDGEYEVRWEDYKKVGERDFPHRLFLSFPSRGETVTLEYNNPSINVGLPEGAFDSPAPKAAQAGG